jgi:outer membrane protein assembly factor BamA
MGTLGAVINLRYSGIEIVRFHGFGNETRLTEPSDFYKVKLQEARVAPALMYRFSPRTELSFGPVFRFGKVTRGTGNIMDVVNPYGSAGDFGELGLEAQFRHDTRDRPIAASRGLYLTAGGLLVPRSLDVRTTFGWAQGEVATYLTAPIALEPTFAFRLGGKKVWGDAPFHEKAYLGGANTLRGHTEQRFAGDAAVYGNAELRLALTNIVLLLPGEFGIFGLADAGRVFEPGETSDQWHTAAGGGIWLAFLDRDGTISVAFATSAEQNSLYIQSGFMF